MPPTRLLRHLGTGLARPVTLVMATAGALIPGTATGAYAANGHLTFRDHDDSIIEHHSSPEGCYNVPREGLAEAAFSDGVAILIDGPDCDGAQVTELDWEPIRVLPHESVLIHED